MDLVDVARAVAKRWWLVIMVVGAGTILAFALARTVDPTYEVRADSLFVGPAGLDEAVVPEAPTAGEVDSDNPYLRFSGSLEVTSEAVARRVDGNEFRSQIASEGYTGSYEFEGASSAPLLTTIAVADQPDDAVALADRVVAGLEDSLAELQDEAGVPADQQIVTRTLTTSEADELTGDRTRILVSVVVLSVVLAIAASVFLESIESRRRLRDAEPPIDLGERVGRTESGIRGTVPPDDRAAQHSVVAWPDGGAD